MKVFSSSEIVAKASDCLEDSTELFSDERYDGSFNHSYYCMFHCITGFKSIVVKSHKGAHNTFTGSLFLLNYLERSLE
ncbi:HEPN domain-containing protein [Dyadobacter sp. 32]|uniref:HEPN domain-containing protein n=1 Tax=Dyadobacter sp. 32 TaxID=538966 RepID=UPI0011EDB6E4